MKIFLTSTVIHTVEEEIQRAIKKQKSGKAVGSDYIPPEALKTDIEFILLLAKA